jgi:hypothetical protein
MPDPTRSANVTLNLKSTDAQLVVCGDGTVIVRCPELVDGEPSGRCAQHVARLDGFFSPARAAALVEALDVAMTKLARRASYDVPAKE